MRNDLVFDIWCCTCTQTELHNVHMEYRQQLIRDANSWQDSGRRRRRSRWRRRRRETCLTSGHVAAGPAGVSRVSPLTEAAVMRCSGALWHQPAALWPLRWDYIIQHLPRFTPAQWSWCSIKPSTWGNRRPRWQRERKRPLTKRLSSLIKGFWSK